jgi:predicted nucleic acid-binding protein
MSRVFFEAAGRYGRLLKNAGLTIPLSDLLIATHCLDHLLVLIENDRHFAAIVEHLPLRLSAD